MGFNMPNSVETEDAVIGNVIANGELMGRINHLIDHKDFYNDVNRNIFKSLEKMHKDHVDINLVTVQDQLKATGYLDLVGGASGLVRLADEYLTPNGVVSAARIIAHKSMQRRVLSGAAKIANTTQLDIPVDEMVQTLEETVKGISQASLMQNDKLSIVGINEFIDEARSSRGLRGSVQGLSTGFYDVDDMTKGFMPGELMIVSGHTSHGKTQLATNIAYRTARAGKPVLFVTMEMTKIEMTQRILAIAGDKIPEDFPFHFQSRTDLAYVDVARLVEKAKEQGVKLVVIDHLHYFSRSLDNTTAEISKIVREFKQAAITNEIPVILICHVRKMDTQKRPALQDLRDSSMIAQDSDMVLMVWRDTSVDAEDQTEVEISILKNRNRGLHARRKLMTSDGLKLLDGPLPVRENPDARTEGNVDANIDYKNW